ncbi:MAG: hypothetical protein L0Y80_04505 [Ignavibacteriae bacterium]|nr:hypothetical protein [Ignavibacteriota bacterium]
MKHVLFLLCCVALLPALHAQQPPTPCKDSPEFRQFDFWIGEWEVRNPKGVKVGESNIQLIIADCVIFENWTGAGGGSGKSFNVYNAATKKWQQFWVGSGGGVLEFSGGLNGNKMEYTAQSTSKDGNVIHHRMTYFNNPDKTVRQLWENSTDGGKQWTVAFDGLYVRKN